MTTQFPEIVLRHEVWVETGGMFTGLMRAAA